MFYPTVAGMIGGYEVRDQYFRFMLLADTLGDSALKDSMARKAFLWVIATRDACRFDKMAILDKILEKCPDAIDGIEDDTMVEALKALRINMRRRGELMSVPELKWVAKYIRTKEARQEAEKIVFSSMLLGGSSWDKIRHEQTWTIPKSVCVKLILEALKDEQLGSKRKIELAKEIKVPTEEYERRYFRKLLWDRHYDVATRVGMKKDEDVFLVVQQNLDAGYFTDALDMVRRFLPDKSDLVSEIERIIASFKV